MRRLLLGFLLVAGGCSSFSAAGRAQAKRDSAAQESLKTQLTRSLNEFRRSLKGKVWDSVAEFCFREDPDVVRALKTRTEALWKRGQLLDLVLEVRKVTRDKDFYVAQVRWERTLLERGQLLKEEGKCEMFFKKIEGNYVIFSVSPEAFF